MRRVRKTFSGKYESCTQKLLMGASPSNQENKEETTVTKEENKNEVVYNQSGMKVFNVHGETLAISLIGTIAMIFVLVGIYKFVQRRGWWKKKRQL